MISKLELEFFKCFGLLKLPIADITLLTGPNASGKSSVLQALVLLHQTMRDHEWSNRLMLNGNFLNLGTVSDVVDEIHGRHMFRLVLIDDENTYRWEFSGERKDMSMAVDQVNVGGETFKSPDNLRHLLPIMKGPESPSSFKNRLRRLTYITAERIGPREFYTLEDPEIASVVGSSGEHTVSLLYLGRDEKIIDKLVLPDVAPTRLQQVNARMKSFFPECDLDVQEVPHANLLTLGLRTASDTGFHRPINEGFGLTQVLPIVVAALSSKAGDIMLIENPEVHLHPSGQSLMGQFLCDIASAGIQVILETHSDHVLNGIRRSVKEARLPTDKVAIHFFRRRSEHESQVISPTLDASGSIDCWPDGFFDQFDKDVNYFAGWDK